MLRSNLKKMPELESVTTLQNHHHQQQKATSNFQIIKYLEKVKFIKTSCCIVLILQKIY